MLDVLVTRHSHNMSNESKYTKPFAAPIYLGGNDRTLVGLDYIPKITQADLDKKTIYRYFCRKANDVQGEIVEIEESKYNALNNVPLYITVKIPWRISGSMADNNFYLGAMRANVLAISTAEKTMEGINKKLTNPLQYYYQG